MLQRQSSVTGNAVSEESPRAGKSAHRLSSRARDPTQAGGSHKPACTIIVPARGPAPRKGGRDDMRVVLWNGDRILSFALVIPSASEGPHPSSWITQAGLHKIVFWMFGRYPTPIICAYTK